MSGGGILCSICHSDTHKMDCPRRDVGSIESCRYGCVKVGTTWDYAVGCSNPKHWPDRRGKTEPANPQRDVVAHYTVGDIETIDYIYDKLGVEGGNDYILGNLLKYASRAKYKGQLRSDLVKIRNYATIMLEHNPEDPA